MYSCQHRKFPYMLTAGVCRSYFCRCWACLCSHCVWYYFGDGPALSLRRPLGPAAGVCSGLQCGAVFCCVCAGILSDASSPFAAAVSSLVKGSVDLLGDAAQQVPPPLLIPTGWHSGI